MNKLQLDMVRRLLDTSRWVSDEYQDRLDPRSHVLESHESLDAVCYGESWEWLRGYEPRNELDRLSQLDSALLDSRL